MKRRLFIGIDLPLVLKRQLENVITQLKPLVPNVKWVQAANLHVTLHFLGSTSVAPQTILTRLTDKLKSQDSFELLLEEVGLLFGSSASIIYEIKPEEELMRTYYKINNEMELLGFPREKRPFHPHLTLGRTWETNPIFMLSKKIKPKVCAVSEISLFQSKLTPQGAIYSLLGQVELHP